MSWPRLYPGGEIASQTLVYATYLFETLGELAITFQQPAKKWPSTS